jgi:hypothetical protein
VSYQHVWGFPNKTSGFQNYVGGRVYTSGIGMPTARVDWYGNRPIRIHSFGDFYRSSGFMQLSYAGFELNEGGIRAWPNSGGTFTWSARSDGLMYFGRDEGVPGNVISANSGFVWPGALAGSFFWDQVPNPPTYGAISAEPGELTITVNAPDNGGTPITQYWMRYRRNGGAWSSAVQQSGRTFVFGGLAPGNYSVQTWADNAVGASQIRQQNDLILRAGGRRRAASSWEDNEITRRFSGTSWVDLNTKKRWNGSAFVDLSI